MTPRFARLSSNQISAALYVFGGGEAVRAPGKPGERTGPQLVLFKRFKSLHDTSLDRTCALNLRGERMRDGVVLLSSSQGGCELPKLLLTKCHFHESLVFLK